MPFSFECYALNPDGNASPGQERFPVLSSSLMLSMRRALHKSPLFSRSLQMLATTESAAFATRSPPLRQITFDKRTCIGAKDVIAIFGKENATDPVRVLRSRGKGWGGDDGCG